MNVLLVEDDVKFATNLKKALEIEGYNVVLARSGAAGLARGLQKKHDLIILDVMLPGKDGFAVCNELRGRGVQLPIIMLTARDALGDRVAGLDSGADDYLIKPFGFEELFARLRSLLRRKKSTEQPLLKVGDLSVNPATREVRRGKHAVHLTPTEYKLLVYLLRNRHKVVTRHELIAYLWKSEPHSNQLDVYVRYVRKKISGGRAEQLIHTVKNVGYKIDN